MLQYTHIPRIMAFGRDKQQISHSSVGLIVFFFCSGFFLKGEMTLKQEFNKIFGLFPYLGLRKLLTSFLTWASTNIASWSSLYSLSIRRSLSHLKWFSKIRTWWNLSNWGKEGNFGTVLEAKFDPYRCCWDLILHHLRHLLDALHHI